MPNLLLIMKKLFLLLFAAIILLGSCKKKVEQNDVIIFVKATPDENTYNSNETIVFSIESFANEGYIKNIDVTSVTSEGIDVIFDTLINEGKTSFYYLYRVPIFPAESQSVKLVFTTHCSTGNSSKTTHSFTVLSEDVPLEELGQFTIYSSASSKKSGFSIELEQAVYSGSDSIYCDLYDKTIDSSLVLSREWQSKTEVLFARFNDFNYEGATKSSVMNAYKDANKVSRMTDISNDDIIFVGRGNTALGVIKVVAVYDDEGFENDRYNFYLKKIE